MRMETVAKLSNGAIFNDLERPLTNISIKEIIIKVTPSFDAEYLRNGPRYRHNAIQ